MQVGKYECIYQSIANINPTSIMSGCCRKPWSRIYGRENIIVKPILWKEIDGAYEQLLGIFQQFSLRIQPTHFPV